jgi:ketosteroid isomerase-like protein/predicted ester cyclase
MGHPNEQRLRDLYAVFAKGDLQGFLDGCTDDVTFHVPGTTPASGIFTKGDFARWIGGVMTLAEGTFQEHVLDVFADNDRGLLQLHHEFDRAGVHRSYLTSHAVEFSQGRIARWEERPGSLAEFEAAWGTREGSDPETIVRRIFEEIVNQHRIEVADDLFTADYVDHGPMGDTIGRDAFKATVAAWLAAVPDVHCSVENLVVNGAMAGWVVRTTGTHTGDGLGFPATGKRFETLSANLGRLENGRAAEHWCEQGIFPMLVQLGLLPPMTSEPPAQ